MRKEEKKNLILMGLTAVCLLVIYLLLGWMQSRQSAQDDTTVYTLDQDAVVELEYGSSDNTVKLVKKDNIWVYADDENFPLNQNFVETMVNKTTQLKARSKREKCVSEIRTGNALDCSTGKDERPSDQNPSGRYQQRHRRLLYGG